jgi:hypothetical protein
MVGIYIPEGDLRYGRFHAVSQGKLMGRLGWIGLNHRGLHAVAEPEFIDGVAIPQLHHDLRNPAFFPEGKRGVGVAVHGDGIFSEMHNDTSR